MPLDLKIFLTIVFGLLIFLPALALGGVWVALATVGAFLLILTFIDYRLNNFEL